MFWSAAAWKQGWPARPYYELVGWAEPDEAGTMSVASSGARFPIGEAA
jgi:hypothetical protein